MEIGEIKNVIETIAKQFGLTRVSLFGSYANGNATGESDIDLLVEFDEPDVSLFQIVRVKLKIEELTGKEVDVIHAPIPEESILEIDKEVLLYVA